MKLYSQILISWTVQSGFDYVPSSSSCSSNSSSWDVFTSFSSSFGSSLCSTLVGWVMLYYNIYCNNQFLDGIQLDLTVILLEDGAAIACLSEWKTIKVSQTCDTIGVPFSDIRILPPYNTSVISPSQDTQHYYVRRVRQSFRSYISWYHYELALTYNMAF